MLRVSDENIGLLNLALIFELLPTTRDHGALHQLWASFLGLASSIQQLDGLLTPNHFAGEHTQVHILQRYLGKQALAMEARVLYLG